MNALLKLLWDVCRLKRGPQELPASPALVQWLVALSAAVILLSFALSESTTPVLPTLALSLLFLLGVPWLLLKLRGLSTRYLQTLAAFAGTGLLFSLAFVPLAMHAATLPIPEPDVPPTREQLVVGWLTLGLVGWKLAINGHIWRHALNWPMMAGVLLAAGLFVLEIGLMQVWFGAAAAQ